MGKIHQLPIRRERAVTELRFFPVGAYERVFSRGHPPTVLEKYNHPRQRNRVDDQPWKVIRSSSNRRGIGCSVHLLSRLCDTTILASGDVGFPRTTDLW